MSDQCEIAVVGAGVIGLTIALRLAEAGRDVAVFDPGEPGSGASYGNAGTIAAYAVQPVGTPEVLRHLPRLLFDQTSPLAIRRAALGTLAPWLLRFTRESLPGRARRNAVALAGLLAGAPQRWDLLALDAGAGDLMQNRGCLYLYATPGARQAAEADMAFRRTLGVAAELVSADDLASLEPGLPEMPGGAMFFRDARFLVDPGRTVGLVGIAARRAGARIIRREITQLARDGGGVRLGWAGGGISARRVVIAAGAHSQRLARMAGDRVPLETERGYHLEFDMPDPPVTRPASVTARGFYFCPMRGRLRVAGTVELGGLTAPPSQHRLDRLLDGARSLFPDLPAPSRTWMGFRPSMPDSLPVIGPSSRGAEVIHAYGHGHIGLTLAPVTAEIVSALVEGRRPPVDITPFRVGRF